MRRRVAETVVMVVVAAVVVAVVALFVLEVVFHMSAAYRAG